MSTSSPTYQDIADAAADVAAEILPDLTVEEVDLDAGAAIAKVALVCLDRLHDTSSPTRLDELATIAAAVAATLGIITVPLQIRMLADMLEDAEETADEGVVLYLDQARRSLLNEIQ